MTRIIIDFEEILVGRERGLQVSVSETTNQDKATVLERAGILAIRSFITSNTPCPTTFIDAAHQIERDSDHFRKQLGLGDGEAKMH